MKIAIGNDHVAVGMKNEISEYLVSLGHEVINRGTDSSERCDYPVYGEKTARAVVEGKQCLFELKYTIRSHSWCLYRRVC